MSAPVPDLFLALVARESGRAEGLVPRLPMRFEAAPAAEVAEPFDTEVPGTRATGRPVEAATEPTAARPQPTPGPESPVVERRHEVVRIEDRVHAEIRAPEPVESQRRPVPALDAQPAPQPVDTGPRRVGPGAPEPEAVRRGAPPPHEAVALLRPSAPVPEARDHQVDAPRRDEPDVPTVNVRRHRPERSRDLLPPAPSPAPEAPEPVVHVSIGRVEVRAVPEPAPRARRTERRTQSLDDYLDRRNRGSGA